MGRDGPSAVPSPGGFREPGGLPGAHQGWDHSHPQLCWAAAAQGAQPAARAVLVDSSLCWGFCSCSERSPDVLAALPRFWALLGVPPLCWVFLGVLDTLTLRCVPLCWPWEQRVGQGCAEPFGFLSLALSVRLSRHLQLSPQPHCDAFGFLCAARWSVPGFPWVAAGW